MDSSSKLSSNRTASATTSDGPTANKSFQLKDEDRAEGRFFSRLRCKVLALDDVGGIVAIVWYKYQDSSMRFVQVTNQETGKTNEPTAGASAGSACSTANLTFHDVTPAQL
jgi:hypothetical protein